MKIHIPKETAVIITSDSELTITMDDDVKPYGKEVTISNRGTQNMKILVESSSEINYRYRKA